MPHIFCNYWVVTKVGAQTHGIGRFFGFGRAGGEGAEVFRLVVGGGDAAQGVSGGRATYYLAAIRSWAGKSWWTITVCAFNLNSTFARAKQHFGLEDFMDTTATGVENAANLMFLLVNVSAKLLADSAEKEVGVLALKARFRGCKDALEAITMLLEKPETILSPEAIAEVKARISQLGCIHRTKTASSG